MSLKLIKLGLSNNPTTPKTEDGLFNKTKDGRRFLILQVQDADNPVSQYHTRIISEQFDALGRPTWRIPLANLKESVAKQAIISGEVVTKIVEPFEITSANGTRMVDRYTIAVFGHEMTKTDELGQKVVDPFALETVFLNAGHKPVGSTRELPPRFRGQPSPSGVNDVLVDEHSTIGTADELDR